MTHAADDVSLRRRIMLPLSLTLAVLLGAFSLTVYQNEKHDAEEDFARDLKATTAYYQRALRLDSEKLGSALEILRHDTRLAAALRANDREALLRHAAPLFGRLRGQYGITHLYFEDAARVNVLRVHQPDRHGDTIDRHTTLQAERTGDTASGPELGPMGSFTLRAVAPLRDGQGLAGYIELGEEIDDVLHSVTEILGTEHVLVIDKRLLSRPEWENRMQMLHRDPQWDRLGGFAVAHQSMELPDDALAGLLRQEIRHGAIMTLDVAGRHYYAGAMAIADVRGRTVGRMIVLHDRTQSIAAISRSVRNIGLLFVALGGALLYLFYLVSRRIEARLEHTHRQGLAFILEREKIQTRHIGELEREHRKLKAAEVELKKYGDSLARAQAIAHLGSWEWDIVGNRLTWSDEIYRIFGLEPQAFGATYEAFLERVHPDDREHVRQAVDAALARDVPYATEHRIVRPDGTERNVIEMARLWRDAAGRPTLMAGTVQDITGRRLAEEELRLADEVFENSIEGIIITDARANIVRVNRAFCNITGYDKDEVVGRNPKLLRSNRHDAAFYQAMWASLLEYGYWQGEIWNRRKNGEIYPEWLTLIAIRDESGNTLRYAGIFADLTEKKRAEARSHHLAFYDTLTELPNRLLLESQLKQALATAQGNGRMVALLHLNLDRFRNVNDTLGHTLGDELLKAVTHRLAAHIRDGDTLARLSGDEFAILLADIGSPANAELVARKLLEAVSTPFDLNGQEIFVTTSVGIALYPLDAADKDGLLRNADTALGHAKAQGGNACRLYDSGMSMLATERLTLESGLRHALERGEFQLYYQPQVSLRDGRIVGMEALLRWNHPERGTVAPGEFIPLLEETGLIVPVGEWVLRSACAQTRQWLDAGLPPLRVAVNLSVRQFRQDDLADMVGGILRDTRLPPDQLELEVTESLMIQDIQATLTTLHQLHDLGIQIAIDDFGTGYSSLSYLKRLPIGKIKIDQSFVRNICEDDHDRVIANAIISMGHSMKVQVIAEGVETAEQLAYLRTQDCDEIQGYYFSRPLPAGEFARLLSDGPRPAL